VDSARLTRRSGLHFLCLTSEPKQSMLMLNDAGAGRADYLSRIRATNASMRAITTNAAKKARHALNTRIRTCIVVLSYFARFRVSSSRERRKENAPEIPRFARKLDSHRPSAALQGADVNHPAFLLLPGSSVLNEQDLPLFHGRRKCQ
jgi:hypothetical protein